jgi:hypothetical protein
VDAGGADTGFVLLNAAFGVVDGFHVTGAGAAGIQVRSGSDHAQVRHNVVFSNQRVGIDVKEAADVGVINNLVYGNGTGGIQTGGTQQHSARALIRSNTCFGNGANGITIGAGGPSPCARVWYNVIQGNGENGIQIGSYGQSGESLPGYDPGYNINMDGYGPGTPRPDSDLVLDPLFVLPGGPDGILGGDGFEDDLFQLQQIAAGQAEDSPAVDLARAPAEEVSLNDRSTRSDGVPDSEFLDLGYHYPNSDSAMDYFNDKRPRLAGEGELPDFCYEDPAPPLVGDCKGDGSVTVNELVIAVNIALGQKELSECPAADQNGDGQVTIDELVVIVAAALESL